MGTNTDSRNGLRYRNLGGFFRERFGARVQRIPIDAGFACPHRDRNRSTPGCLYCDAEGSGAPSVQPALSVREQTLAGMARARQRYGAERFLPYFQAYTNTLDSVERLRELYAEALDLPDVVGLAIGTRPDTVSEVTLDLLEEIARSRFVCLEYGMESRHDATLQRMNRQHTFAQLVDAVERSRDRGLHLCLHIILGLPGETRDDMLATVDAVADLSVDGVKIHSLYIDDTMPLAADYRAGRVPLMEREVFVELVIDALERLPSQLVIHRLMGEGRPDRLLGPLWALDKTGVTADIHRRMIERDTVQGQRRRTPVLS